MATASAAQPTMKGKETSGGGGQGALVVPYFAPTVPVISNSNMTPNPVSIIDGFLKKSQHLFRNIELESWITKSLRNSLANKVKTLTPRKIAILTKGLNAAWKEKLQTLLQGNRRLLLDDIESTSYRFRYVESLRDHETIVDARTEGFPRAPIFISIPKMTAQLKHWDADFALSRLVPLFFHEHVRHFGFDDDDHQIAQNAFIAFLEYPTIEAEIVTTRPSEIPSRVMAYYFLKTLEKYLETDSGHQVFCGKNSQPCKSVMTKSLREILSTWTHSKHPVWVSLNGKITIRESFLKDLEDLISKRTRVLGYYFKMSRYKADSTLKKAPLKPLAQFIYRNQDLSIEAFAELLSRETRLVERQ